MARRRRSQRRSYGRGVAVVAAVACSAGLGLATGGVFTVGLTVNGSIVYDKQHTMTVRSELKPSSCSALTLSQVRNIPANTTFGNSTNSQLWLGNAGQGSTITAGKNNDCVVPGAVANGGGNDLTISGGNGGGNDVCYDGPGPGNYVRNSCNTTPTGAYPYLTVATASPTFT